MKIINKRIDNILYHEVMYAENLYAGIGPKPWMTVERQVWLRVDRQTQFPVRGHVK